MDIAEAREIKQLIVLEDGAEPIRHRRLEHPDGIYINLPTLDYLNDWALSYSAMKTLNSSPPDWHWESPFNLVEDHLERSTPALRFGSALHCGLLEPEGELEKRFAVPPNHEDDRYKGYIRTIPDLKTALKSLGLPVSGNRPELVERLLEHDPGAKLWDLVMASFFKAGFTALTEEQLAKLRLMIQMAKVHPGLKNSFTGVGMSEVSIFWTDEQGIRQRARLDRMKPKASIDLKSFSNWQGRDFRTALLREAALRQYPMQAAHYDVGRREGCRLFQENKVWFCAEEVMTAEEIEAYNAQNDERHHLEEGAKRTTFREPTEAERETLAAVFGSDVWEWVWIFYKTDGAPTALPVRLNRDHRAFQVGMDARTQALAHFVHYREMFGLEPGKMWLRMDGMWTPDDTDWPAFMDPNVS